MARKKQEPIALDEAPIAAEVTEVLTQSQNVVAVLQQAHSEDRDLVNQLLGQAQMADAFGKFSQTVWASKLTYVKENKLYKAIAGQTTPNGLELKGTWEEFCSLLAVSDEKANQDIANLREFGEEALDSMSRMGIGYREMRQFRRLPADEKTALIEVAKSGDKEALVEFAETIFEKHAKEKEEFTKKMDEQTKVIKTKDEVAASHKLRIDELLEKSILIQNLTPDEVATEARNEASAFADEVEERIRVQLAHAFSAVAAYAQEHGKDPSDYLTARLDLLDKALLYVRGIVGIERTVELTNKPEWEHH